LLYNLQTNSNIGVSADTMVGVAYLDKGLIVITDPTIIANYELATGMTSGVTVTLSSVSTSVFKILHVLLVEVNLELQLIHLLGY
jgi:hypothetical protein